MMPGFLEEDAKDVYRVMQLAWNEVQQDIDDSMESPEEMEDNSVEVGNISETTNDKILN